MKKLNFKIQDEKFKAYHESYKWAEYKALKVNIHLSFIPKI